MIGPPIVKPVLVLIEHGLLLIVALGEEAVRVEGAIAEELETRASHLVRSAPGDQVDVCPRIATKGGIVLPGLHLELLDRVGVRDGHAAAGGPLREDVVDAQAVHLEVVVVRAIAMRVWRRGPTAATTQTARVGDVGDDARRQRDDLGVVARDERQPFDVPRIDDSPQRIGGGLRHLGRGRHLDAVGDALQLKLDGQVGGLGHADAHALARGRSKAGREHLNDVVPRGEQ